VIKIQLKQLKRTIMVLKKLKKPYRWFMDTTKSNCWGICLFYYLMIRTQQSNPKRSLPYN